MEKIPQQSKQEQAPMPDLKIPLPKLMQESPELADAVFSYLENDNEQAHLTGQKLLNRIALLDNLLSAIKEGESNFEIIWQTWEVGKEVTASIREQIKLNTPAITEQDFSKELFVKSQPVLEKMNRALKGSCMVFMPLEGTAYHGLDMTGGTPQTMISQVHSWGVKSRRGDTERKAMVK